MPTPHRGPSRWLALAAFLVVGLAAPVDSAAQLYHLFPISATQKALEFGNANKIVNGVGNSLHAVYVNNGNVMYSTSLNGAAWTSPVPVAGPNASQPAIAIDGAGRVVIAWVASLSGPGTVMYAYRLPGSSVWNQSALGVFGAEPAIATVGSWVHLAWVETTKVQYATFPTLTPFAFSQETVESADPANCAATRYRLPAIAITSSPDPSCPPPNINIAYLVVGSCGGTVSSVGPRVRRRNSTTPWNTLYSNVTGILGSPTAASAVSLSMSGTRATGHLFLAWSDKLASTTRTMLAKGLDTTWTAVQQTSTARHVHVRSANRVTDPTLFRLGWTTAGAAPDPYFNSSSTFDTATWTGAAPTWSGTPPLALNLLGAGRPQPLFWQKCIGHGPSGILTEVRAYFESAGPGGLGRWMAIHFPATPGCPFPTIGTTTGCMGKAVLAATVGLAGQATPGTLLDLEDIGVITRVSDTTATVTTPTGGLVTVAWRSGSVAESSDTSLTLTAPRADVTVTSRDAAISVVELGHLAEYDVRMVP